MPRRAAKACVYPGCPRLVRGKGRRYCDEHRRKIQARYDAERESSAQRGYDARWRRLRKMYLNAHPLCADPYGAHAARGELVAATEVDHIVPKRQGGSDAEDNLQALCKPCHSRKTTQEMEWGGGD